MGKFKISLELQGFKLNVEGDREDLPAIQHGLQQQLTGMLTPPAQLLNGDEPREKAAVVTEVPPKKARRRGTAGAATSGGDPTAISLTHDLEKYGHPRQSWQVVNKAMWLLHVVALQGAATQMSGATISATFNKYFKEAGVISTSNVNRDLGRAKAKLPAQVNSDVNKTPPEWYLTTEGKKIADQFVTEAVGTKEA